MEKTIVEGGLPESGSATAPISVPNGMTIDEFKQKQAEKKAAAPPAAESKGAPAAQSKPQDSETPSGFSLAEILASEKNESAAGGSGVEQQPPVKKLSVAKIKEIEEDIEDDDALVERFGSYKQKVRDLELLAAGRDFVEKDETVQAFSTWSKQSDDKLFIADEATRYKRAGYSDEEAHEKATKRYQTLMKTDPDSVEEKVVDIRARLSDAINSRKKDLLKDLEETSKKYNFAEVLKPSVLSKVEDSMSKTTEFLGMKLAEDKTERKKLHSEAADYVKAGELTKALSDPDTLAEVALFLKYKKQWTAAIQNRTNGKSKILGKLPNTPPSGGGGQRVNPSAAAGGKKADFNPSGFR